MNQHILSQISSSVYINTTYLQGEQSHKNQNSGIEIIPLGKFFFSIVFQTGWPAESGIIFPVSK